MFKLISFALHVHVWDLRVRLWFLAADIKFLLYCSYFQKIIVSILHNIYLCKILFSYVHLAIIVLFVHVVAIWLLLVIVCDFFRSQRNI